jgi:hypothetical protein
MGAFSVPGVLGGTGWCGGAAAFRKDTVWYRQTSLDQSLIFTQPAVKSEIAAALAALNERRAAAPSRTPEKPRN